MLFPVLMDAAQPETFKVDFLAVAIAGVAALVLFLLAARSFLKASRLCPWKSSRTPGRGEGLASYSVPNTPGSW